MDIPSQVLKILSRELKMQTCKCLILGSCLILTPLFNLCPKDVIFVIFKMASIHLEILVF